MNKTITVFGSSLPKENEREYQIALKLGSKLAQKGFNVCSGGYQGIMDAVSKGASQNGAEAIGITVDLWGSTPSKYLTKQIECNYLSQRISKLVELGDAYVVLQGGTGTLLELAVVWELINKSLSKKKPIACHSKMWKSIVKIMDEQISKEGRKSGLIKCFNSVDEIIDYLFIELNNRHN